MLFNPGAILAAVACLFGGVKTAVATPIDEMSLTMFNARDRPKELWQEGSGPSPKDVKLNSENSGWLATTLQRLAEMKPQSIEDLFLDKDEIPEKGIYRVRLKFFEPGGEESLLKFNLTEPESLIDQFDRANDYWWVPSVEYAGLLQAKYKGINGTDENKIKEGNPADAMKMLLNTKYKSEAIGKDGENAKEWIEKSKDTAIFFRTFDRDLESKDLEKRTWYSVVGFEKKNDKIDDPESTIKLMRAGLESPFTLRVPDAWKDLETVVRPE
ncbi:hypothetical protein IAT40_003681 [Kwoniella sp. CBS 6097]